MKARSDATHDLGAEALLELGVELRVAVDQPHVEQRRADRGVGGRELEALVDGARRVPDLEAEIPQHVEHVFGDALAPRRLLVGKQEQKVDVRSWRQHLAPVAACRYDRHALGIRRVRRPVDVRHRVVEEEPHQLVLEARQPRGAAAAVSVELELLARGLARCLDQRLETIEDRGARFRGVAVRIEQRAQLGAQLWRLEIGCWRKSRRVHACDLRPSVRCRSCRDNRHHVLGFFALSCFSR